MIKIYGIKSCSSVSKAIKFLKKYEIPYEFIDFRMTAVEASTISSWLKFTDIKTLFNSRGTTYRNLKLKELKLNDVEKEQWLSKENMLIKRPVISFDNDILVGYNEDLYTEKLL